MPRRGHSKGTQAVTKISHRAKQIRKENPNMSWISAIKQASKELYH